VLHQAIGALRSAARLFDPNGAPFAGIGVSGNPLLTRPGSHGTAVVLSIMYYTPAVAAPQGTSPTTQHRSAPRRRAWNNLGGMAALGITSAPGLTPPQFPWVNAPIALPSSIFRPAFLLPIHALPIDPNSFQHRSPTGMPPAPHRIFSGLSYPVAHPWTGSCFRCKNQVFPPSSSPPSTLPPAVKLRAHRSRPRRRSRSVSHTQGASAAGKHQRQPIALLGGRLEYALVGTACTTFSDTGVLWAKAMEGRACSQDADKPLPLLCLVRTLPTPSGSWAASPRRWVPFSDYD